MDAEWFPDALERARAGDPVGFERLWSRWAGPVTAYLRGRGSAEPEDLTSQVMHQVFGRVDRFTGGEDDFSALVFTIARRRHLDEQRRRGRRVRAVREVTVEDCGVGPSAESEALASPGHSEVLAALATLPEKQREVIVLRLVEDLDLETTAGIVGRSTGAVKALQRRALGALRKELERQGWPPEGVALAMGDRLTLGERKEVER